MLKRERHLSHRSSLRRGELRTDRDEIRKGSAVVALLQLELKRTGHVARNVEVYGQEAAHTARRRNLLKVNHIRRLFSGRELLVIREDKIIINNHFSVSS